MENLYKISAILGIIVIAILSSALALGYIGFRESQEIIFRVIGLLIILTLASALISFISKPGK